MLCLGLAPERCQPCPFGQAGGRDVPQASALMGQGEGMFLFFPNKSHQGR